MKYLLFIALFFFATNGTLYAKVTDLPKETQYRIATPKLPFPPALDRFFTMNEFEMVKVKGEFSGNNPVQWLDRIYLGKKAGQTIFVRSGLAVDGAALGEIYRVKEDFVLHLPSSVNAGNAFYFTGYSEEQVTELRKKIIEYTDMFVAQEKKANFFAAWSISLISSAEAAETLCTDPVNPNHLSQVKDFTAGAASCLVNGVWAATGEIVWMAAKGGYVLVTDPAKAWASTKEGFRQATRIVTEFPTVMEEFGDAFSSLSTGEKAKLFCELTVSLGTGAVISFFTFGAGAPAMYKALADSAAKMAKLTGNKKFKALSAKLAVKSEDAAKTVAEKNSHLYDYLDKTHKEMVESSTKVRVLDTELNRLNKIVYGGPASEAAAVERAHRIADEKVKFFGNGRFMDRYGRDYMGNATSPYLGVKYDLNYIRERFILDSAQQAQLAKLMATAESRANPKSDFFRNIGISMHPRIDGAHSAPVDAAQWLKLARAMKEYEADLKKFYSSIDFEKSLNRTAFKYISPAEVKFSAEKYTALVPLQNKEYDTLHNLQRDYGQALASKKKLLKEDATHGSTTKKIYLGYLACEGVKSNTAETSSMETGVRPGGRGNETTAH